MEAEREGYIGILCNAAADSVTSGLTSFHVANRSLAQWDGWMAEVSRLNQERANEREETVDGRTGGRKKRSAEGEKDRKREGGREG